MLPPLRAHVEEEKHRRVKSTALVFYGGIKNSMLVRIV